MTTNSTDLMFFKKIDTGLFKYYEDAIEYLMVAPAYSLQLFRIITEEVCHRIARYYDENLEEKCLYKKIEYLHDTQLINSGFKGNLHEIRQLCNPAVHSVNSFNDKPNEIIDGDELNMAHKVRLKVIDAVKDLFIIIRNEDALPGIDLVTVETQEKKRIIWDAIDNLCHKKKFKAGMLLLSEADTFSKQFGLVITDKKKEEHWVCLLKQALAYFEAAYKLPVEVNMFDLTNIDNQYEQFGYLEAFYQYSELLTKPILVAKNTGEGYRLIRIAADRGHVLAAVRFAQYAYQELEEYDIAFRYISKAMQKGNTYAYGLMAIYYSEGKACERNNEKAFTYIKKGLEQNCQSCMYLLAIAYHEGSFVAQNNTEAEYYLKKLIELGHKYAATYYQFEFKKKETISAIQTELINFSDVLKANIKKQKKEPISSLIKKVGRNEKCNCGSGKKYKKCCGC